MAKSKKKQAKKKAKKKKTKRKHSKKKRSRRPASNRCVDCGATLRLGNMTPLCAPCTRRPGWHKHPITPAMAEATARQRRLANKLLHTKFPGEDNVLSIAKVSEAEDARTYAIRLSTVDLEVMVDAEQNMEFDDKFSNKIEKQAGVLAAEYDHPEVGLITMIIDVEFDNPSFRHLILTILAAHIRGCLKMMEVPQ